MYKEIINESYFGYAVSWTLCLGFTTATPVNRSCLQIITVYTKSFSVHFELHQGKKANDFIDFLKIISFLKNDNKKLNGDNSLRGS